MAVSHLTSVNSETPLQFSVLKRSLSVAAITQLFMVI
uniref:Uncharacterized protein n=1 Tax=Anguilla anguilla TaxID=7936 RepID=A0A0E9PV17_ANGAN